ncbi:MAG: type Z 30S ribosomal protein S14 [Elusimicrobia bacterium]|nr:type Z 30S ribosomal protein S14 [Elusimicrobiota bacterium]
MAKKGLINKSQATPKFSTRQHNRCRICGRSRAYMRRFAICRLCFREMAWKGEIPGVKKASW